MGKYKYITEYDQDGNANIYIPKKLWEEKVKADKPVYLSDFMDRLPLGKCLFLKSVTGAGATTLALQDPQHSIIALPTRNTVQSKYVIRDKETNKIIGYNTDLFCIYSGFNDKISDLKKYLDERAKEQAPVKIVCTYDQVEKLTLRLIGKEINENGDYVDADNAPIWVDINDYRLFIDEVHQVLEDYVDDRRNMNIRGMLRVMSLYKNVCCITATPLRKEHTLYEIRNFPIYRVIYPTMPQRKIVKKWCPRIGNSVESIVLDYLEGRAVGNAHIFVNSVKFIGQIISGIKNKIPDFNVTDYQEKIRVICGDNEINEKEIRAAVTSLIGKRDFISFMKSVSDSGDKINVATEIEKSIARQVTNLYGVESFIDTINSPAKKINFYTKSSWLGADVFDKQAQIFIVTDGARKQTMIDVSTSLIQILGRIRDSRNNKAYLLLSQNRYLLNEDEDIETQYQRDLEEREKNAKDFFEFLEKNPLLAKKIDAETRKSQCYIMYNKRTGKYEKDDYLRMYDEISFRILQGDYRSSANLSAKLVEVGFEVEEENENNEPLKAIKEKVKNPNTKITFERIYTEYARLRDGNGLMQASLFEADPKALLATFEALEPYVKGAYEYLGTEKVKALRYHRKDIVTLVDKEVKRKSEKDIRRNLAYRIKVGNTYLNSEIDNILRVVESTLHLEERTLKISDYYEVMNTSKRDENGKPAGAKKIVGHTSKKGG